MLSKSKARKLLRNELGLSRKYGHSISVADMMSHLAKESRGNSRDWYLAGLLHDLDYETTSSNKRQHGLITSKMLQGIVKPEILKAIAEHDGRTGYQPTTELSHALRFVDALEATSRLIGSRVLLKYIDGNDFENLAVKASARPYLIQAVDTYLQVRPNMLRYVVKGLRNRSWKSQRSR